MRTITHTLIGLAVCFCGFSAAAQTQVEFKAKNFPPSKRTEFTKAFTAYKEGERLYKLFVKDGNAEQLPAIAANFKTAYAFNPDHIALNRYLVSLSTLQKRPAEAFPHLEKLYDLKADLSEEELFMLASLLQMQGSFTRAELIFKRFQQTHKSGDFWAEGRLQNPEKRIAECVTGSEISKEPVHFSINNAFVAVPENRPRQLYYNNRYGWWALYADGSRELLSSPGKPQPPQSTDGFLTSDLNGQVFLSSNDSLLKQVTGRALELDKLNGPFHNRQPFLDADLRRLYFSSDRPGGYGGYDIWIARFDETGRLLSVGNAGPAVNDQYDQSSPTLSSDGTKFFVASNGAGSTGGSDILFGLVRGDSVESLKNLGFPVNSGYDEREIVWDITGTKGFVKRVQFDSVSYLPVRETGSAREALFIGTGFSSANVGPLSSVKYEYAVSQSFISGICKLSVKLDKPDNVAPEIEIFNLTDGRTFLRQTLPDTARTLAYLLPSQQDYGIHINGPGLVPFTANLHVKADEIFLERTIGAELKPIKKGTSFVLNNIFFSKDYNDMDGSSLFEISRIADWLKQHPKTKVEVAVHTDSLSMHSVVIAAGESAAFQIYELLRGRYGIEKRRLDWMFYGPDKPIYWGRENMSKNRRIELIITDK